jgi:hypothetical protein
MCAFHMHSVVIVKGISIERTTEKLGKNIMHSQEVQTIHMLMQISEP